MCDINDHVRLSAVSACSKAVLGRTGEKKKAEGTIFEYLLNVVLEVFLQAIKSRITPLIESRLGGGGGESKSC